MSTRSNENRYNVVFFISDEIAHEFGWPEMIQMRHRFQQASESAQSLRMRVTKVGQRKEYIAVREALQVMPTGKAICQIWNEQITRWKAELAAISDIHNS